MDRNVKITEKSTGFFAEPRRCRPAHRQVPRYHARPAPVVAVAAAAAGLAEPLPAAVPGLDHRPAAGAVTERASSSVGCHRPATSTPAGRQAPTPPPSPARAGRRRLPTCRSGRRRPARSPAPDRGGRWPSAPPPATTPPRSGSTARTPAAPGSRPRTGNATARAPPRDPAPPGVTGCAARRG